MISPTEMLYWEVLPAIRKELVFAMKEQGLKQQQIAEILDITPSAVSQYVSNKRACSFEFSDAFLKKVKASAKRIARRDVTAFEETNKLIKLYEESGALCNTCHEKNATSKSCNVCFD